MTDNEHGVYHAPWEKAFARVLTPFEEFVQRQTTSGLLLMATAILALILATLRTNYFQVDDDGAVVIPALVFLIPIHGAMLGVVLAIMTVMGVTNHMGWELFPRRLVHSRLGNWLITASHHQRHHEEYRCNYGLYFRHWDRLCGTDRGLSRSL